MTLQVVTVEAAAVWADPTAPRDIDGPAVADVPDIRAWTDSLTLDDRIDLHGRLETQVLRGEPVIVVREWQDWVRIAAPWQPSPDDERGYPGWVRRAHLGAPAAELGDTPPPAPTVAADPSAVLDVARHFVGRRYLWGGMTEYGIDCSGLVHLAFRNAGIVIPRDADPQHRASEKVPIGTERPGDLYFFAKENGYVYHVGFVTGRERMLHAPEASQSVEDAPLSGRRLADLVAVGRVI
jgi:cell wall-associated NlpC family hydrolase